jgi:hypothetical protein
LEAQVILGDILYLALGGGGACNIVNSPSNRYLKWKSIQNQIFRTSLKMSDFIPAARQNKLGKEGAVGVDNELCGSGLIGSSSRKRKHDASDEEIEPSKAPSATSLQLLEISPEDARAALNKLIVGVVPPKKGEANYQPNALGYGPAKTNRMGCLLAQKKPSHVSLYR